MLSGDNVPDSLELTKNGVSSTLLLDNGIGKFTLSHKETAVFSDVPSDLSYEIKELDGASSGYDVKCDNPSGIIEQDITVIFENVKNVGVPTGSMTNTAAIFILVLICGVIIAAVFWKKRYNN